MTASTVGTRVAGSCCRHCDRQVMRYVCVEGRAGGRARAREVVVSFIHLLISLEHYTLLSHMLFRIDDVLHTRVEPPARKSDKCIIIS